MEMRLRDDSGELMKSLSRLLSPFFTEFVVKCDEDGLFMHRLTPDRSCAAKLVLPATSFDDYYCDEPFVFSINMDSYEKIMKRVSKGVGVEFYVDGNNNEAKISLYGKRTTSFSMRLLVPEDMTNKNIEVRGAKFQINSTQLMEILKDLKIPTGSSQGARLVINANEKELVFSTAEDLLTATSAVDVSDKDKLQSYEFEGDPINIMFRIIQFKDVIDAIGVSDFIFIEIGSKSPAKFTSTIGRGGSITYILAPVVQRRRR